jgi:hypothetical protein
MTQTFYTQNGWAGEQYETTKHLSTTEIAKIIRKELKTKFPGCKFSTRSQYFSGGSSIDVDIKSCGFNPLNKDYFDFEKLSWAEKNNTHKPDRLTPEGKAFINAVESVGNNYNRSDCDGMIDYFSVNFWWSVQFDKWIEESWRNEFKTVDELKADIVKITNDWKDSPRMMEYVKQEIDDKVSELKKRGVEA